MSRYDAACYKWMTVLGVFLIYFPLGFGFFWGSLVVYTSSYIVVRLDTTSGVQAPWILNIRIAATALSAVAVGRVKDLRIGKRLCVFTGILLVCGSYFLGYCTIRQSNLQFTIIFSIFNGLGDGSILFIIMDFVLEWAHETNSGLLISVARTGGYVGAVVANQLILYLVNPANLKPDWVEGPSVYFSQKDILDHVPYLFVYLGSCYLALQAVGFFMLRTKSGSCTGEETEVVCGNRNSNGETICFNSKDNDGMKLLYINENNSVNQKEGAKIMENQRKNYSLFALTYEVEDKQPLSMTTGEVMMTSQFYVMCFGLFLNYVSSVNSFTYYKTYGQTLIHDDHFLTHIGMLIPVINIFTSVQCGHLLDKYSVKSCLVCFNAFFAAISVLFYLSLFVNRWVFAVATLVFTTTGSCTYTIYSISLVKLFGKTHQASNVGVMSLASFGNLALSPLFEIILLKFGWFFVFLTTALLNLVVLFCFIILFRPLRSAPIWNSPSLATKNSSHFQP